MKPRVKDTIFDQPAYAPAEAARILGLPVATLRAWSFGQTSGGGRHFQPVIKPADKAAKLLSFANLCELHVLSAIRRNHRISLPKVRASLDYVRERLDSDRPLLDRNFTTCSLGTRQSCLMSRGKANRLCVVNSRSHSTASCVTRVVCRSDCSRSVGRRQRQSISRAR